MCTDNIYDLVDSPDLDDMTDAFFFHGKESGPHGTKNKALGEIDPSIISPDFQGKDLAERLKIAEEATEGFSDLTLVGSSMGGLVAALLYQKFPNRIANMVLLAPAFHWAEAKNIKELPPTVIIHGEQDEVVPISASEFAAKKFGSKLVRVQDGHRLHEALPTIVKEFEQVLES